MAHSSTTENYGLPQWISDNKPVMEDFNNAFSAIDSELNAVRQSSDSELKILRQIADGIYPGVDLTVKHAAAINADPCYGNAWMWIKARIKAGNFDGIHIGDYIPWVSTNGVKVKSEVAGINTYKGSNYDKVGNHIDFISRDCWPDTHAFNKVTYNNGTSVSPSPWLASDLYAWLNSLAMNVPNSATANPALIAVDYTGTGVYDKLPTQLKDVIVTKVALLPHRYTAGSLLVNDNNWGWGNMGKLWVPSEVEVCGTEFFGSKNGYSGGSFRQYPIFTQNMHRIKGAGDGGPYCSFWTLSTSGGYSGSQTHVSHNIASSNGSAATTDRAPICFRIA